MMHRLTITGLVLAFTTTAMPATASAQNTATAEESNPFAVSMPDKPPYDREYPVMHYGRTPTHNAIARLQQRVAAGEVKLTYSAPRGYLDSLLAR